MSCSFGWRDKFAILQRFFRKHGHSRVPSNLDTEEYPRLGPWVGLQRCAWRNELQRMAGDKPTGHERLSKWKMAKLRSVVFEYDQKEAVWQDYFSMLKEFEQWEGHTRVPFSLDTDHYPRLGRWVRRQRAAYRVEQCIAKGEKTTSVNRISKAHIAQLEELGFEWKVQGKPIPKIDPSEFEGLIV